MVYETIFGEWVVPGIGEVFPSKLDAINRPIIPAPYQESYLMVDIETPVTFFDGEYGVCRSIGEQMRTLNVPVNLLTPKFISTNIRFQQTEYIGTAGALWNEIMSNPNFDGPNFAELRMSDDLCINTYPDRCVTSGYGYECDFPAIQITLHLPRKQLKKKHRKHVH